MSSRLLLPAAVLLIITCAGCAQRRHNAVTATPMPEELAPLPQVERITPATVGVIGRHETPTAPLLPPFPEPGPTPAERKILGPEGSAFRFLEYPNAVPPPSSRPVGSFVGGPAVAVSGFGRVSGVGGLRPKSAGVFRPFGGAATAIDNFRPRMAGGNLRPGGPTGQVGPSAATRVETDPRPKQTAGHNPHNDN